MKVTKAQALENRQHIVETASVLFRERGYDGVGVAELMATAGFTHGGFYKHFGSKADLMAEAAAFSFEHSAVLSSKANIADFVKYYLSPEHRDAPGNGCTMAALCTDASRQTESVKETFAAGIEKQLAILASKNAELTGADVNQSRARQIALIAQAVGAIVLSRSCPQDSPLADEILEACLDSIAGLSGQA
ncbi:TetR family transcriptional regulator [Pokkaliibacter sp. MBI-7]|uniref:TetR/AcrR family transcriptional regulator n=1 Tax=Pokkaliibacter sp. MBI-7 TaxID=3040600 RepID=UPI0024493BEB|nr:TetR family transcriptional regulator [Pokkaliibacter sp. MBI-7]MDH2435531.1 TetR family transcriptional regulator [Pokkaliibacter sp. MBI-7]